MRALIYLKVMSVSTSSCVGTYPYSLSVSMFVVSCENRLFILFNIIIINYYFKMECELCYEPYSDFLPKVLKCCPHTYCHKCLLEIKEREGKARCPICPIPNTQTEDIAPPTNEALMKAIRYKEAETKKLFMMKRYEIICPSVLKVLSEASSSETLVRKQPPFELHLSEVTASGELIYIEELSNRRDGTPLFHHRMNPMSQQIDGRMLS